MPSKYEKKKVTCLKQIIPTSERDTMESNLPFCNCDRITN